jgi:hypothetical protein
MPIKLTITKQAKFGALILIVVVIIAGLVIDNLGSSSPPRSLTYGLALGYTLPTMSQEGRVKELSKIKSLGFNEVRFDLAWNIIQPKNNNTYNWTLFDQIMQDVKDSGLKSVVTLDRTPVWARPATCKYSIFCAPAQSSNFAKFAAAAVKRYQGYGINAWEIWNEPNIVNFWKPEPNPSQYVQLIKASYLAIKRQDPGAIVLIGGLAGNADNAGASYIDPRTFLERLYSDKAKNYFNGVAYHPYTNLRLPQNTGPHNGWSKMYITNPSIRSIMVANGDQSKEVWITEFGAPTNGPGVEVTNPAVQVSSRADHVSPAAQAQIALEGIHDAQKIMWIKDLDWYTYSDSGTVTNTPGNFYGLLQNDGKPKAAYFVFQKALK